MNMRRTPLSGQKTLTFAMLSLGIVHLLEDFLGGDSGKLMEWLFFSYTPTTISAPGAFQSDLVAAPPR